MNDITILSIDTIVSNPNIRSGKPIIAGTTLRVQDVAAHHRYRKYTPEELAEQLQISLAQVHAALAYYYEHKAEIDAQIEEDDRLIQEAKEKGFGQRHPPVLR
jgi:uncharacterized protein (DUF433 family)